MSSHVIKITALDPGITTGYATGLIENGEMGVISGQAKWNEYLMYEQLRLSHTNAIVYETFEYRYTKKREIGIELFSRNLIGVINLYAQQQAIKGESIGLYTQTPAKAKGHFSDQLLKKHNVYKIAAPHANDAMRHLLTWFVFGPGYKYNQKGFKPLA